MWNTFANPTRFARLLERIMPVAALGCIVCFAAGLYLAFIASPPDYQQGEYVRIMYIHVPAAWWSLGIYAMMASSSFIYLVWRHSVADILARQSAAAAIAMCAITVITGSLWGKPTWGAYWVWDARLTSMLLLLCILIGYDALARQSQSSESRKRVTAICCVFGALNLPIIKFSVDWWATLHQPASILRSGGMAIDASMRAPLFTMAAAYLFFYIYVLAIRVQAELLERKIARHQHAARRGGAS